jgi:anti-sigma regulatory factor (Ser/Thr protein kinase)/Pyruvate/2-oxoacid:ferredoxin oxidoreductase delta subunit
MNAVVYTIQAGDYEHGGAASRSLKEQLKQIGADPAVVRRAMIAAYEAEMNVVIHSHGGALRATLQNGQLDVEVTDIGPGIADVAQALKPGFSTASAQARELGFGAGMGLPNIRKNSDRFEIHSQPGVGTKLRFSIALKPQALYGDGGHSIHITPDQCQGCFRCLHTCPTRAVRVFREQPSILDYLCVDCVACIASCPSGAIYVEGAARTLQPAADVTLVVPPAGLVQFGADVTPQRTITELRALGYADVRVTAGWEAALRRAVVEYARANSQIKPVIVPMCAAVINLIETRFPSLLLHVAPFVTPLEALRATLGERKLACVVTCPCQRTTLLRSDPAHRPEVYLPGALRAALLPRLHAAGAAPAGKSPAEGLAHEGRAEPGVLQVSGALHVVNVLEQIEDGQAGDLPVVEPYMCGEAGFGTPLLREDPFLTRHRWEAAGLAPDAEARAVPRAQPYAARPGLRLDDDMTRAIQKLARIDKLTRSLPGVNCGLCGAPTCAALAEDIVLGRAEADACVRQKPGATSPARGDLEAGGSAAAQGQTP